jgi:hypothetical protein
MFCSIDYYSYTIPTLTPFKDGMFYEQSDTAIKAFASSLLDVALEQYFALNWTHEGSGRFYQHRLRHDATDVALSYGKVNAHIFVELAGKACNNFDARGLLMPLIERTHATCTRIDFAVDIKCETSPAEFVEQRGNKSFKSSGNKYSPTGGTEYLGGRSSERMARVYRYNAPHPRHEFLRVEAEYKGDAAKASAEYLASHGLTETCLAAHKPFDWQHVIWNGDASISKIPYKSYNPQNASTVRWLYGDVITALRKATKAGLVDLDEWLAVLKCKDKSSLDE